MRTTVDLDEDVLTLARALARAEGRSIGAVISTLVRRGLEDRTSTVPSAAGFPVFDVPAGGRVITSESVREAQDD